MIADIKAKIVALVVTTEAKAAATFVRRYLDKGLACPSWLRVPPAWMPWLRYWVKAILALCLLLGSSHAFLQRYGIGFDPQDKQCLPGARLIIYDKQYQRPHRGEVYAFVAEGLDPYFEDGTKIWKVVDGVPGDKVDVTMEGVAVNGKLVALGLPLAETLGSAGTAFIRTFVVPPRHYLMLGRTPESFDGRYWGLIDEDALIGRVWQPWKDWK